MKITKRKLVAQKKKRADNCINKLSCQSKVKVLRRDQCEVKSTA